MLSGNDSSPSGTLGSSFEHMEEEGLVTSDMSARRTGETIQDEMALKPKKPTMGGPIKTNTDKWLA